MNIRELFLKTSKQVQWWSYAAWTLPFVALIILGAEYVLGWGENIIEHTLIFVGIVFFSISVYWWWWALHKIRDMIRELEKTQQKIDCVRNEIIETRLEIKKGL